jgi:hypothetical protein
MKKNFRVLNLPKTEYWVAMCICNRCGKEFSSDKLVYGVPEKGHTDYTTYPHWYCPTEDCNGFINSGVYYKTTS